MSVVGSSDDGVKLVGVREVDEHPAETTDQQMGRNTSRAR